MIAIYARQSVDKKDSISIETQIEVCKRKLKPEEDSRSVNFIDKGFSGKSTNRPEFQRMMSEVITGQVSKIIVYKVDRISRSMLDFLNMKQEFSKYDVEFISCMEDFDTSTSTGKMMMNLLMMFAEMEREAIQKRITDNYYARGKKGLYLGGYAPFGYKKTETHVDGKKTYTFDIIEEDARIIKYLYNAYANENKSLGGLVRELNKMNIKTQRDCSWNSSSVSRLLHNPIYVKANPDVYTYLKNKGATLNNSIDDFIGVNGCYVYGKVSERTALKFSGYKTDFVTIGLHKGIIDASLWLSVQYKFDSRQHTGNLGTGQLSWLQGLVKCSSCGYSCYVKKYKNSSGGKSFLYFYCRGKRQGTCEASRKMLRVDNAENAAKEAILNKLLRVKDLDNHMEPDVDSEDTIQMNHLKIQIIDIEDQIHNLVSQISNSSEISMKYINREIERLDEEKIQSENKLCSLQISQNKKQSLNIDISRIIDDWEIYSPERKSIISKKVLAKIEIDGNDMKIFYN